MMTASRDTKIVPDLLLLKNEKYDNNCCRLNDKVYECNICFGSITKKDVKNKKAFVCTKPCKKIYHSECLTKSFNMDNFNEDDMNHLCDKNLKCPYCRREFELQDYNHLIEEICSYINKCNSKRLIYSHGNTYFMLSYSVFMLNDEYIISESRVYMTCYGTTTFMTSSKINKSVFKNKKHYTNNNTRIKTIGQNRKR